LAILNELYRETGDEKFFRFHCLFRPWDAVRGEIISLTGHLAENDLQGNCCSSSGQLVSIRQERYMRRKQADRYLKVNSLDV